MFNHITATSDIEDLYLVFEECLQSGQLDKAIEATPEAWIQDAFSKDLDWLAWSNEQAIVLMTANTLDPSGQTPPGQPWLDIVEWSESEDDEESDCLESRLHEDTVERW